MDKLLRKLGLSGRSIVPMLIGFGCTVPGVMASSDAAKSERDRKMTILIDTVYELYCETSDLCVFYQLRFSRGMERSRDDRYSMCLES